MRNTKIYLSKENLIHNFNTIQSFAKNTKLIPVIKSEAYGHGQKEIATMLNGLDYFALGIAYTNEAYKIREYDVKSRIFLVVPIIKEDVEDVIQLDLIPTIESYDVLFELNNKAKERNKVVEFHIFVNTGMNRDGVESDEMQKIISNLSYLQNVKLTGILSHFAQSEGIEFSAVQIANFENIQKQFELNNLAKHISNSNAIIRQNHSEMSYIRPGLFLYGVCLTLEEREKIGLKPVLSLKTKIKNIIKVRKGETVGYSFKYIADKDIEVGILPIGYSDGYSTLQYNKAQCLIKGKRANIIGSICMDLMMCDITGLDCEIGEEVTLIGKDLNEEITINELADNIGVIPYEIMTSLKSKIERVIV